MEKKLSKPPLSLSLPFFPAHAAHLPPQLAAGQAAFLLRTCGPPEPARPTAAAREPSNLLSLFFAG
jgi:hypothetical protein